MTNNHPDQIDTEIDQILKPYFAYEVSLCGNCGHDWYSHYWNGGGNPDNSGWDKCKIEVCECEWKDATQANVIDYDKEQLAQAHAAIKLLMLKELKTELETMQVIDFEPDDDGAMTLDEYLADRISNLEKEVEGLK